MISLNDMLRAGSVKRFHIVNTTRVQTLSEHQYGVAVIAGELARRMGFEPSIVAHTMALAIVHDVGETRTGDIPTPTKKRLREALGTSVDEVLGQFDSTYLDNEAPPWIKAVLKCADYLESMTFLQEHKVGRHADAVMRDISRDAAVFFNAAGDVGDHASKIWHEFMHNKYEI